LAAVVEEHLLAAAGLFEPAFAEIVAAPFHEDGGEFIGIDCAQQGNIFLDQLFLQRNGVRGNDDPLFHPHGVVDRGQQIRERFSDAGARFDEQMMPFLERALDAGSHLELLWAEFVAIAQSPGDGTALAENVLQGCRHLRTGFYPNTRAMNTPLAGFGNRGPRVVVSAGPDLRNRKRRSFQTSELLTRFPLHDRSAGNAPRPRK